MGGLLAERLPRRLLLTTAVGSLGDWTVFAALVAVVARLTDGSVFAVTLVTAARLVPSVLLGPLVPPRVAHLGARRVLVLAELGKAAALLVVGTATNLTLFAAGLVTLELVALLSSATREAAISAGVARSHYPTLNTATAALGYGMIPVGGLLATLTLRAGPVTPFLLAAAASATSAGLMAGVCELDRLPRPVRGQTASLAGFRRVLGPGPLRQTVVGASVGVLAIAMLFATGPQLATTLLGDPADHGLLLGLIGAGALLGGLTARRGVPASPGLVVASVGSGLLLAGGPAGVAGLVAVGAGAGLAYVATQARLQTVARAAEEFAAAFAVLKVAALTALVAAPVVYTVAASRGVLVAMTASSLLAAGWYARHVDGISLPRLAAWTLARAVLAATCRVRVDGVLPDGPAVLASNHPNLLDGPVAVLLDPRVRPVAKPQRRLIARLGLGLAGALLTGGGATGAAVAHLQAGGLVWLAPGGRLDRGVLLHPPRSGASRMAAAVGVPIVPVAIRYATPVGPRLRDWRPWRRPLVRVVVGEPVDVRGHRDLAARLDAVMLALAALSGQPYAGAQPTHAVDGSLPGRTDRPAVLAATVGGSS